MSFPVKLLGMPAFSANALARDGSRDCTPRISWLVCSLSLETNLSAIQPGPQIPQRRRGTRVGSRILARGRVFGNAIRRLFTRAIPRGGAFAAPLESRLS